ncbi:MAG: outer membrane lipoprotein-sorting protein [Candidatus Acidiferrales bacterium]
MSNASTHPRRKHLWRGCAKAVLLLVPALAFTALPFAQAQGLPAQSDPRTIMAGVYGQDTSHDRTLHATLDVFDKTGQSRRKKFVLLRVGTLGDSKTLVRFTDPAEIRGVTLLSINQRGVSDRQFIYIPAQQRVRTVSPRERSERFVGSDFTFEDIAEPVLDDFTYRRLADSDDMEGHKTFKIQAEPVDSTRSQYKFVYYWVAQDVRVILHEEMYDQDGHLVRTLHASGLRKVSGIWGARRVEVQTVPDGTRTVLTIDEARFNTGLSEELFTPNGLGTPKS